MKRLSVFFAVLVTLLSCGPKDGMHTLHILTTNDVHGAYFDSTYVGGGIRKSLCAVKYYVDSVRNAVGEENVLLIDAGDVLQGDNAAYYFNYVDTITPHVFPRIASYMGYDVVAAGNHDIETGHHIYDRISADLKKEGIAFLGGNVTDVASGKPYFPVYKILHKAGLKVAVLGYTNANIKAWLDESLWSGLDFKSLMDVVQSDVDMVIAKEKPQLVVVAVHSGTGKGDGSELESQGKDLFDALKGVDVLVCAHDHRPYTQDSEASILINSGSHARNVGHGEVSVETAGGKVISKQMHSSLIPVDAAMADGAMREVFKPDFDAVRAFTLREVGALAMEMRTRDAYKGMCDYLNLIHTVSLDATGARISLAAPLTFNGRVKAGTLVFNDMFTIYPFENQLFVVNMTGKEIKDYLEMSYDGWINTVSSPSDHLLKIEHKADPRTGQDRWSFIGRSYNFDSAAGLVYSVDVTAPCGQRVQIVGLSGGEAFSEDVTYPVAMTSYRASGGGGLMPKGAGIGADVLDSRIVGKYPEIRNLIYDFIVKHGTVDHGLISDPALVGGWSFIPENIASAAMERDFGLMFKN